jgi:hypothetical protein
MGDIEITKFNKMNDGVKDITYCYINNVDPRISDFKLFISIVRERGRAISPEAYCTFLLSMNGFKDCPMSMNIGKIDLTSLDTGEDDLAMYHMLYEKHELSTKIMYLQGILNAHTDLIKVIMEQVFKYLRMELDLLSGMTGKGTEETAESIFKLGINIERGKIKIVGLNKDY